MYDFIQSPLQKTRDKLEEKSNFTRVFNNLGRYFCAKNFLLNAYA
jgi:hypothetical protein